MESNTNPSSNGFHHTPDGQAPGFISPDELLNAIRRPMDAALLCSEDCAHPWMKTLPPGKCDGKCRQRLLNEGSRGMRNSPLRWESFQKAERQYQEAINEYKAVGLDLNNAAPIVFG